MGDYLEKYLKKENESIVQLWNKIIDKQMDFTNELLDISIQNNIKSYECLIEQKKETITEYTKLIDIFLNNNEVDIATPTKSLIEKQNEDIDKLKQDLQSLNELHGALMDKSLDEVPKRVFENLQK